MASGPDRVSLELDKKYLDIFEIDELLSNEADLKSFWMKQGQKYWTRFCISLRECTKKSEIFNIDNPDATFIDILKLVVAKNFSSLFDYLEAMKALTGCDGYLPNLQAFFVTRKMEIKKEVLLYGENVFGVDLLQRSAGSPEAICRQWLPIYGLHKRFVASLYAVWKARGKAVSEAWQVPLSWAFQEDAGQFEHFLRARWGKTLLAMLGCTKEQLCWWRAKAAEPSAIKFDPHPWLPRSQDIVGEDTFRNNVLWNVLNNILPPLLARKFHINNARQLCGDSLGERYANLTVVPWFVHFQEAIGRYFLSHINLKVKELAGIPDTGPESQKEVQQWFASMIEMARLLMAAQGPNQPGVPRLQSQVASSSREFLLEPMVLIQVPWSNLVRHQWLAAALIEIMKFELSSLELRHWPLPKEVEQTARELLSLVRQAKECVLLGVYLHAQQAIGFQGVQPDLCSLLLDRVVLPASAILDKLSDRTLGGILEDIKQVAFTQTRSLKGGGLTMMNSQAYLIKYHLAETYTNHYWHLLYWLENPGVGWQNPVPDNTHDPEKLTEKTSQVPPPSRNDFSLNESSPEESLVQMKLLSREKSPSDLETFRAAYLQKMFDLGYFPKSLQPKLFKNIQGAKKTGTPVKKMVSDRVPDFDTICQMHHKLTHGFCHLDLESSILSSLVRLSGEVLAREQLVRLAARCAGVLGTSPVLASLSGAPQSLQPHLEVLRGVRAQISVYNREWLLAQLPVKWRILPSSVEGLDLDTEWQNIKKESRLGAVATEILGAFSKLSLGENTSFDFEKKPRLTKEVKLPMTDDSEAKKAVVLRAVDEFEHRLGYMISGLARLGFDLIDQGSSKFLSEWPMLQYLMPCHFSALVALTLPTNNTMNLGLAQNLVNVTNNLLTRYEIAFGSFVAKTDGNADYNASEEYLKYCPDETDFNVTHLMSSYYASQAVALCSFFTAKDPGINIYLNSLLACPMRGNVVDEKINWQIIPLIDTFMQEAWQKVGHLQAKALYLVCQQEWNYPKHGQQLFTRDQTRLFVAKEFLHRLTLHLISKGLREPHFVDVLGQEEFDELFRVHQALTCINVYVMNTMTEELVSEVWCVFASLRRYKLGHLELEQLTELVQHDPENLRIGIELYAEHKLGTISHNLQLKNPPVKARLTFKNMFAKLRSKYNARIAAHERNEVDHRKTQETAIGSVVCSACGLLETEPQSFLRCTGQLKGNIKMYYFCKNSNCIETFCSKDQRRKDGMNDMQFFYYNNNQL